MGYIAPVNNHQYQQYAERVHMKSYDPFQFVPSYKITPHSRFKQQLRDELEKEYDMMTKRRKNELPAPPVSHHVRSHAVPAPHVIQAVTGKGQNFNESI